MIRKAIIVVLTLAAASVIVLGVASYLRPKTWAGFGIDARSGDFIHRQIDESPTTVLSEGLLQIEFVRITPLMDGPTEFRVLDCNLVFLRLKTTGRMVNTPPQYALTWFRIDTLYLPLWVPLVLFATYPTVAFVRGPLRRFRRRRTGRCVKCGYDLAGNVSGTCPECGTRIEEPPPPTVAGP